MCAPKRSRQHPDPWPPRRLPLPPPAAGSFNSWAELLPLAPRPGAGVHSLSCCLPQGHYQFQFFVDGQWLLCPTQPTSLTEQGRLVNRCGLQGGPPGRAQQALLRLPSRLRVSQPLASLLWPPLNAALPPALPSPRTHT